MRPVGRRLAGEYRMSLNAVIYIFSATVVVALILKMFRLY
jgi:hypothetical protein